MQSIKVMIRRRLGERKGAPSPAEPDDLFGWRKARRCKRLIRRVQFRLKLLKNKRLSITRQLRKNIAQLIKTGYRETAIDRAGQLFKDESILDVYVLLERFCQVIQIHLRDGDCPGSDILEAVSSLVFASPRCWDLPELRDIRDLFEELYGDGFIKGALELCPGNLVNQEIRDKLSVKSVPHDVKLRLVDKICGDQACGQPEILALGYASDQLQTEAGCNSEQYPCYDHESDDSVTEKQLESAAEQDKTGSDTDTVVYNVFTFLGYEPSKRNTIMVTKQMEASPVSESETDSCNSGDHQDGQRPKHVHPKLPDYDDIEAKFSARKKEYIAVWRANIIAALNNEAGPVSESETDSSSSGDWDDQLGLQETYSRAMSVPPPERPKEKIQRSVSWPLQQPKYVHPKLPDYDDIAAEFSARKRKYIAQRSARIIAAATNEPVKSSGFCQTIEFVCTKE